MLAVSVQQHLNDEAVAGKSDTASRSGTVNQDQSVSFLLFQKINSQSAVTCFCETNNTKTPNKQTNKQPEQKMNSKPTSQKKKKKQRSPFPTPHQRSHQQHSPTKKKKRKQERRKQESTKWTPLSCLGSALRLVVSAFSFSRRENFKPCSNQQASKQKE